MPHALAAADACLAILQPLPLYSTVYPNKVFDYMAAGRPVLLAIDGVIHQVVEGAQADPALCRQLGLNARRFVEARSLPGTRSAQGPRAAGRAVR